jgi:sensor histidine kinase regulating citrate/malate metabolism
LLASIPHPALLLDSGGVIRLCNSPTGALCASPKSTMTGETFEGFLQKAGLPSFLAEWPRAYAREELIEINGAPCTVTIRPIRLRNRAAGSLIEFKGFSTTENAPEELTSVRQQLQELLSCIEISSDGFCIMDSNTR